MQYDNEKKYIVLCDKDKKKVKIDQDILIIKCQYFIVVNTDIKILINGICIYIYIILLFKNRFIFDNVKT